jgi:hypothetical protein
MRREDRRRSDARFAALAVAFHVDDPALRPGRAQQEVVRGSFFSSAGSIESPGRGLAAVALGVFVAAAAVALAVVSGSGPRRFVPIRTDRPAAAQASANAPLELMALEHDRDGDRFIVRGVVRNPAGGAIDGVAAVVSVFGRDGGLITSGRAAVPVSTLDPGAETPFVVTVSGADDVDRYHLSFRTAAGMVPHLDRRAHGVMARLP